MEEFMLWNIISNISNIYFNDFSENIKIYAVWNFDPKNPKIHPLLWKWPYSHSWVVTMSPYSPWGWEGMCGKRSCHDLSSWTTVWYDRNTSGMAPNQLVKVLLRGCQVTQIYSRIGWSKVICTWCDEDVQGQNGNAGGSCQWSLLLHLPKYSVKLP